MSAWTHVAGGAAAIALLELDAAAVGPFLLSRPFVVGPLLGAALGDPWTGALFGVAFEALTLEELPLGGCLHFSASVAAGVAVWLAAGPAAPPSEAAFLVGLGAGWAHARLEKSLRRGRASLARGAEAALAAGRPPLLGARMAEALAGQAGATFAVAFASLAAAGPALSRLWPVLPEFLHAGARTGFLAAPWLGGGSLAASLWRRA